MIRVLYIYYTSYIPWCKTNGTSICHSVCDVGNTVCSSLSYIRYDPKFMTLVARGGLIPYRIYTITSRLICNTISSMFNFLKVLVMFQTYYHWFFFHLHVFPKVRMHQICAELSVSYLNSNQTSGRFTPISSVLLLNRRLAGVRHLSAMLIKYQSSEVKELYPVEPNFKLHGLKCSGLAISSCQDIAG